MPLKSGYSYKTVQANIAQMVREGYPRNQAVAASLENARKSYFKRFPHGALPPWLTPSNGKRTKNPAKKGCGCSTRRRNPVPESSRSTKHSRDARVKAAADLYERFTGHEADEAVTIDKPDFPDVVLVVGDIDFVGYTTVRDGVTERYIHKFKKDCRPLFAVSHDGKQLFMLGGSYDGHR